MKGPRTGRFWTVCAYEGLGGFGRSAHTRGWAVLDGLRSKELKGLKKSHILSITQVYIVYFRS